MQGISDHTLFLKRPSHLASNCRLFSPDLLPFCQLFPLHVLLWHFRAVVVLLTVTFLPLLLLRLFHPFLPLLLLLLPPFSSSPCSSSASSFSTCSHPQWLLLLQDHSELHGGTFILSRDKLRALPQSSPLPLGYNPDLPLLRMGQIPTGKKHLLFGYQWIYISNAVSLNLKINVWLENKFRAC